MLSRALYHTLHGIKRKKITGTQMIKSLNCRNEKYIKAKRKKKTKRCESQMSESET